MAYIKNTWVDQEVERPRTYQKEDHADGSFTLIDDFGLVSELGTPVNADNMNHIEEGIGEHEERITALENLPDVYLKTNQITNCITEIPQRIKADVVDGTLTVYAGTVAIVPYGTEDLTAQYPVGSTFIHENFKVVDTQYTVDDEGNGQFFVWVEVQNNIVVSASTTDTQERLLELNISNNSTKTVVNTTSSNVAYSGTNNSANYRTDLNIIQYHEAGVFQDEVLSFPIMRVKADGANLLGSISQVFNGIGYIGTYTWKGKDIVGLSPNGFNNDGTLANIEWKTDKCVGRQLSGSGTFALFISKDGSFDYVPLNTYELTSNPSSTCRRYYNSIDNYIHSAENNAIHYGCVYIGTCTISDGKITSFDVKQPFRAVDYSDLGNLYTTTKATTTSSASANRPAVVVQNYKNGQSWYRVWSDGWIEQGFFGNPNITLTLPKSFSDTSYTVVCTRLHTGGFADTSMTIERMAKNQIKIHSGNGNDTQGRLIYACGY